MLEHLGGCQTRRTQTKMEYIARAAETWYADPSLQSDVYSTFLVIPDMSFTKAPEHIRLIHGNPHEIFQSFAGLASLAFPEAKRLYAGEPTESQHLGLKLPIDDQLMCYDYLYYASSLVVSVTFISIY